ncbi:Pre-mRNA-splicing factor SPF27 [Biscogniauxia marginata]|nr:Pre-mRNA-splicing factor SPF27 [Biscogniauxia marginata]
MSSSTSIRTTVHESLPYIDPEPTPTERASAQSLIDAELSSSSSSSSSSSPSPSPQSTLPPPYEPKFTPLLAAELSRIASGRPPPPGTGIDLSRYEAPSSPSSPQSPSSLHALLPQAYASLSYLSSRAAHLSLLSEYGRNAWLVSNWRAEAELAALERELAAARRGVDLVNLDRRRAQDAAAGELASLADAWRRGVGRVLEVEVAAEGVRREVLERRRGLGGGEGADGAGAGDGGETEMKE